MIKVSSNFALEVLGSQLQGHRFQNDSTSPIAIEKKSFTKWTTAVTIAKIQSYSDFGISGIQVVTHLIFPRSHRRGLHPLTLTTSYVEYGERTACRFWLSPSKVHETCHRRHRNYNFSPSCSVNIMKVKSWSSMLQCLEWGLLFGLLLVLHNIHIYSWACNLESSSYIPKPEHLSPLVKTSLPVGQPSPSVATSADIV